MNAAKTTSERVAKLRADRDALGLKRLELYAHPEDWPAIKALAERLQRKRAKKLAAPRARLTPEVSRAVRRRLERSGSRPVEDANGL